MGVKPVNETKTVTTAGTRVQVTTNESTLASSIYFEALKTNSGNIYVGISDVSSTKYIACLAAGEGINISTDTHGGRSGGVDLALDSFYVDSSVNGEKCQVSYLQKTGSN